MDTEKKLAIIFMIALVIITMFAIIYFVLSMGDNGTNQDEIPVLSTDYENITAEKAYTLFLKSNNTMNDYNLIIIDARVLDYSCPPCLTDKYEDGHIPGAILDRNLDAKAYYQDMNETNDILVYNKEDSSKTVSFCEDLIGYVYGNIYNLDGGYLSWKDAGYPIEKTD